MRPGAWLLRAHCFGCGRPLGAADAFCFPCQRFFLREPPHPRALCAHEGPGRRFVASLRGDAPARMCAWALTLLERAGRLPEWRSAGIELVLSAPQSPRRQASGLTLLADALAQRLGAAAAPGGLRKAVPRTQHGKSLRVRMDTECFVEWAGPPGLVAGKRVLVLDDVHTTGTTLDLCAFVLRSAGARAVHTFCLAYQVMPGLERKHEKAD